MSTDTNARAERLHRRPRVDETRTGGTRTRTRTRTRTTVLSGRVRAKRWARTARRRTSAWLEAALAAVTPLGWFIIAATVIGCMLGWAYAWIEAWFVGIAGAVLILIALPFLVGSRSYRVAIDLERRRVVAGADVSARLHIMNSGARPALPTLAELPVGNALREVRIPFLAPRQELYIPTAVPTQVRGVVPVGPLTIARQDPLAMFRREVTWPDVHLVHVHPVTVRLPPNSAGLVLDIEGAASRRIVDSDLSFYAVREYVAGDPIRHIHWRSSARTGTAMVRQYEESQTARVAVLFDAIRAEYVSDDEFELGVSLAASLSVQAVREGRERFIASGWVPPGRKPRVDGLEELPSREGMQLLDAWAELDAAPEAQPIDELAHTLAHSLRDLSIVSLVTGSTPDVTRLRRAASTFPADVHVLAVRAELHAEPRVQHTDQLTLFTVGALDDLPQLIARSSR